MMAAQTQPSKDQESGVVLILAAVIMLGVGIIAAGSMEITLTHATYGATRLDRRAATALAEGGIDVAYQALEDDPTYRGSFTVTASTGANVEVTVSEDGANLQIHSVAGMGSVVRAVTAHLAPVEDSDASAEPDQAFTHPMETPGRLTVAGAQLEVTGGPVLYGQLRQSRGGTIAGDFRDGSTAEFTIDSGPLRDLAKTTLPTVLEPGVYRFDVASSTTNVTLNSPATVTGTLIVDGHLWVEGSGDVVLGTPEEPVTLVVTGMFDVPGSVRSVTIHGLIVAGTHAWFYDVGTVNGTGGIFGGSLNFENTTAAWTFDPSILSVPPGVTGLPVPEAPATIYAEFWRQTVAK